MPEFPRERIKDNAAGAQTKLGVSDAVPMDTEYAIWTAFHNEYWPAAHFVDQHGRIRFHHFGEGR